MEGDGPIMGTMKKMGLIIVGTNLPTTDATVCRIMGLDPFEIPYLRLTHRRIARLEDWAIEEVGESWKSVADPFRVLDYPHLRKMQVHAGPKFS
jgi:uncharacterized protein (DUF362 family)